MIATALFEAHIEVANLDTSIAFYRDVLGFELAYVTPGRRAAFFWIGSRGRSMLGVWAAGSAPQRIVSHVAFAATVDDVLASPRTLRAAGVAPLDFDGQPTEEPVVLCWMPAASIYFRDPDGHLLEYLAMLDAVPEPERGVVSWSAWQLRQQESAPAHSA
ncbi:MAG TPA: VOC family protein [Vicinamibacterales bacterium]|jgi:lactoylglutathione lyase